MKSLLALKSIYKDSIGKRLTLEQIRILARHVEFETNGVLLMSDRMDNMTTEELIAIATNHTGRFNDEDLLERDWTYA